jgi:predicted permease
MLQILLSIAPIFALIVLGHVLRRNGIPSLEFWNVNDKLVYGAVPTAPGGFTLARQMGGDAPVMAGMITLQTVVAFVTLPLTLALGDRLLGMP